MSRLLALLTLLLAAPVVAQGVPLDPEPSDTEPALPPPPAAQPPAAPSPAPAPVVARATQRVGPARLSGPRVGVTILNAATVDDINETFPGDDGERISMEMPVITQFGWQFETRLFQTESGLTGVTEVVGLVGGLDRNLLLPSATFLVGMRTVNGMEIGMGPNLSLSGTGYAVALGMNTPIGEVNVPINVAAVFGQGGPRISLLAGFTLSSRTY
ncbi:hypothetical protein [Rubrivirga sp.]|uniref:hypothetical protein n=1 Tax=Rubrivirga sp. TaxID=1885344 RepID=UPI003B5188FE